VNESLLVNTLGHSAGVLIFGIFLFLAIQDRSARQLRGSTKSMLAAALALVWNLASLAVLGMGTRTGTIRDLTVAIAFSVLSLLPAVLFDLCLADRQRSLAAAGYALSFAAILLHVAELFQENERYHRWGLTLITVGFGVLTCVAATRVFGATTRLVGTMSLFLLAMSFVHLWKGDAHQVWSRELAFHHAAIPLALLVLLQDYRFVLLDAFLRFLANVLLAGLFVSGVAAAWRFGLLPNGSAPFDQALLLAGACLLLIAFAMLRGRVQSLLTRLVFLRPDINALLQSLKTPVRSQEAGEREYVAAAAAQLGEFMGARATVAEDSGLQDLELLRPALVSEFSKDRAELESQGVEAVIPLHLARGAYFVLLGRRTGGRRYLSEDLLALGRAASAVVEQIEQFRESEMRRLAAQAELRALQSQIHPHFLFNALNALYGIIPREAIGARETVLNLADIFRYFLETRRSFLPLEEELRIVRAYLQVERLRLGEKLRIEINVSPEALSLPIPILSIQPLVENAVKHGIAPKTGGGVVTIEACLDPPGTLSVTVRDTGAGFAKNELGGVGLENVTRRLELYYGSESRLRIRSGPEGCQVSFAIPLAIPSMPAPSDAARPAEALR
jgi:two-component system, LytTR family, sensor kinase